ncbi:hypothetical protein [Micromonospora sp. 4G55]|uniref:hypothetical protein n=1 Tax=Micromonospora sp. 4G55 TaxID=2806102 RepID=UPI001A47067F|nr:hypothetical protein [Micromonospora sp. 4G55]MBM0257488.1 hypothetical protein [Micromonospora sp. 4G55]
MRRTSRIVVALLVSGPLGACGSGSSPEEARPSVLVTTSAAAPSPPAARVSLPEALSRYVTATYGGDHRYVGDCASARPDPRAVCSLEKGTVDAGTGYAVGAPYSEIDAFLLLREDAAGWRVVDDHVPPESGGPTSGPEPDWFARVGS